MKIGLTCSMQYEVRWPGGQTKVVEPNRSHTNTWVERGPGAWDVRIDGVNHRVLLLSEPDAKGHLVLRIDGVKWAAQVADDRMLLLERMGMNTDSATTTLELVAPMPGKVLSVEIGEGQEVDEGDPLLVLEAMKMENVLKSPRSGRVKGISAIAGTAVEKGAVLVTFADE